MNAVVFAPTLPRFVPSVTVHAPITATPTESAIPEFSKSRPIVFFANRANLHEAWTPQRLEDELNISRFPGVTAVLLKVAPINLDNVVQAITAWNIEKIPVILKFKHFGFHPECPPADQCFGLTEDQAYERVGNEWVASDLFQTKVKQFFARSKRVSFA